jgi:hypothetical protein
MRGRPVRVVEVTLRTTPPPPVLLAPVMVKTVEVAEPTLEFRMKMKAESALVFLTEAAPVILV